jgi:putative peptidoglycan lipid II flippase
MSVSAWTALSRITGVARVAVIGAVLGPTFFGNTFQFTNSLPNLVYFGFLAGSLFSSLLIPALVRHIDQGDRTSTERVAGGFLGVTFLGLLVVAPLLILVVPPALGLAAGPEATVAADQERVARLLLLMLLPQVFLYGVVGSASAVMYARHRFALAAAAPALENFGMIAVLLATGAVFGPDHALSGVPTGELLLLGFGATASVALHAGAQWWGARRAGVTLVPRAGWRDPEVREVVRRTAPSLIQSGLIAVQTLFMLFVVNRVSGGIVALQMALNFYYLPIAVVVTPVAVSLLPRLARLHMMSEPGLFRDTFVRGWRFAMFLVVPAVVGYLALAWPIARTVSIGKMNSSDGVEMIAVAIIALSVGMIGQATFTIATQALYSRKDTRTPLLSMALQALVCLILVGTALAFEGPLVLAIAGAGFSLAGLVGAAHVTFRLRHSLAGGTEDVLPSIIKVTIGAIAMFFPARLVSEIVPTWLDGRVGELTGLLCAAVVGFAVFLGIQVLLRTPELALARASFSRKGSVRMGDHEANHHE